MIFHDKKKCFGERRPTSCELDQAKELLLRGSEIASAQAGGEEQPDEPSYHGVRQQVSLQRRDHGFHRRIVWYDQKARVFLRRRSRHCVPR